MDFVSNPSVSTCMLKQQERMGSPSCVVELYLDSLFSDSVDDFFQDKELQQVFVDKETSTGALISNQMSIMAFLGILSSMKAMGWVMIGSNAYTSRGDEVVKCFYFEKAVSSIFRAPIPQKSPTRTPPVPARRNSRTPTKMAVEISAAVVGIASVPSPVKPAPPPPAAKKPPAPPPLKTAAESLGGLTRDRVTIDAGKRTKPAGLTSKQLLQQLAATRKKQEAADFMSIEKLSSPDSIERRPPVPMKVDIMAAAMTEAPPPLPPRPVEGRVAADSGAEAAAAVPLTLPANPVALQQRRRSFRAPPAPLQTTLSADDMQDTPYVTPALTAPAVTQSNTTVSSISPRALRAPPPIPTTPDNSRMPSHFTFDDISPVKSNDESGPKPVWPPGRAESQDMDGESVSATTPKRTAGVGNTYRSMLKSFQAKNKISVSKTSTAEEPGDATPAAAEPPPAMPRAASMGGPPQSPPQNQGLLPRSASIATTDHPAESEILSKSNPINNGAVNVTLPDEKNIQFYERNLQFFKKMKEEEDKKKAAVKELEDSLPEEELAELQMKRQQEEERERAKTAHLQAFGRGLGATSGRGMMLTGRGGRGRGSGPAMPSAPPPPPPPTG